VALISSITHVTIQKRTLGCTSCQFTERHTLQVWPLNQHSGGPRHRYELLTPWTFPLGFLMTIPTPWSSCHGFKGIDRNKPPDDHNSMCLQQKLKNTDPLQIGGFQSLSFVKTYILSWPAFSLTRPLSLH
jgi:hypothetical protein